MPQKRPRRGRLWPTDGSCVRQDPMRGHVWSYDFVVDRTHKGRPLRMLTAIDDCARRCLAIRVGRRLTAEDVQECLTELFCSRAVPEHIRPDYGPDFTGSGAGWESCTRMLFIELGSPRENECIESINGKPRDELMKW